MSAIGDASLDLPEGIDVFVSHRSTRLNRELAEALVAKLQDRKIQYFLDEKNIHLGDAFTTRISESIRRSRLVVVFFPNEMSAWEHFEAACAFFDRKLLPVAVDGGVVPSPYAHIHHVSVNTERGSVDHAALERVAVEIDRRLHGERHAAFRTKFYGTMNHLFFSGLPILFGVLFALVLLGLGPGTHFQHINHLHVVLGAVILGAVLSFNGICQSRGVTELSEARVRIQYHGTASSSFGPFLLSYSLVWAYGWSCMTLRPV
jgi:hypothetical protein